MDSLTLVSSLPSPSNDWEFGGYADHATVPNAVSSNINNLTIDPRYGDIVPLGNGHAALVLNGLGNISSNDDVLHGIYLNSVTISFWFNAQNASRYQNIVSIPTLEGFSFSIGLFNNSVFGSMNFPSLTSQGVVINVTSPQNINSSQWYFVVLTFGADPQNLTLFVNGSTVNSTLYSATPPAGNNGHIGDVENLTLGGGQNAHFVGDLDSIMIYVANAYNPQTGAPSGALGPSGSDVSSWYSSQNTDERNLYGAVMFGPGNNTWVSPNRVALLISRLWEAGGGGGGNCGGCNGDSGGGGGGGYAENISVVSPDSIYSFRGWCREWWCRRGRGWFRKGWKPYMLWIA